MQFPFRNHSPLGLSLAARLRRWVGMGLCGFGLAFGGGEAKAAKVVWGTPGAAFTSGTTLSLTGTSATVRVTTNPAVMSYSAPSIYTSSVVSWDPAYTCVPNYVGDLRITVGTVTFSFNTPCSGRLYLGSIGRIASAIESVAVSSSGGSFALAAAGGEDCNTSDSNTPQGPTISGSTFTGRDNQNDNIYGNGWVTFSGVNSITLTLSRSDGSDAASIAIDMDATPATDYGDYSGFSAATQVVNGNLRIGNAITDGETANPANSTATGDDNVGDDEDLTMPSFTVGTSTNLVIPVTNVTGVASRIRVFADWNGDGDASDSGETQGVQSVTSTGNRTFALTPPTGTTPGTKYLRIRLAQGSSAPSFSGTSTANGEVEDYAVNVVSTTDYGDYSGFAAATQVANSNLRIGTAATDGEGADPANSTATGDDNVGDDEDLTMPSLTVGTATNLVIPVTNVSGVTSRIIVFADWNGDGDASDSGETQSVQSVTSTSNRTFALTPPTGTTPGTKYLRIRLAQGSSTPSFSGTSTANGEVEDYAVTVAAPPTLDYGDHSSYASVSSTVNSRLYLGAQIDAESSATTNATATGDDTTGIDDEDAAGTIPMSLLQGARRVIRMRATNGTGSTAYLNAWIDFNRNNVFDSGEQVTTNVAVTTGTSNATFQSAFTVPTTASVGTAGIRVRLTSVQNPGPDGLDGIGEVEDYMTNILSCPLVGFDFERDEVDSVPRTGVVATPCILNVPTLTGNKTGGLTTSSSDNQGKFGSQVRCFATWEKTSSYSTANQVWSTYSVSGHRSAITFAVDLDPVATGSINALSFYAIRTDDGTNPASTASPTTLTIHVWKMVGTNAVWQESKTVTPIGRAGASTDNMPWGSALVRATFTGAWRNTNLGGAKLLFEVHGVAPGSNGALNDRIDTDCWCLEGNLACVGSDYGDYSGFAVATQVANSAIRIGTLATDAETANPANSTASGDDNVGDDEDLTMPSFTVGTATTLTVPVTITAGSLSGSTSRLNVFVDWNGDGDASDTSETQTVQSVTSTSNRTFSLTPPTGTIAGTKYLRIRFTEGSTAPAFSGTSTLKGEVEDYAITVNSATVDPNCYNVLVANYGGYVNKYDSSGNLLNIIGSGSLTNPSELAAGPDGNVLVSCEGNSRVDRINPYTNAFIANYIAAGGVGLPSQMVVGTGNVLYMTDMGGRWLARHNAGTGALLNRYTRSAPQGVMIGLNDKLFVVDENDRTLARYSNTGTFEANVYSFSAYTPLHGAFLGADGNYYVGNHTSATIDRITPAGVKSTFLTMPAGSEAWIFAGSPDGRFWVGDTGVYSLKAFNSAGTLLGSYTASINNPCGVLVVPCSPSDFGDLKLPYPTRIGHNGPRHIIGTLKMGANLDADGDGITGSPTVADGDDTDSDGDDEDGVTIPALTAGTNSTLTINSSGAGRVNAFFDWNNDGDFLDASEAIAELTVAAGNNNLTVAVPSGAITGTPIGARFRLSSAGGLTSVGGLRWKGEVWSGYLLAA